MSNALPMALFRPSCAAIRTSAPVSNQWSTVTRAFARRYCSQQPSFHSSSGSSLLSLMQSHSDCLSGRQSRSFSTTPRTSASVYNPSDPSNPPPLKPKKRTIRIGPLPGGEPSPQIIRRIFGPDIPFYEANNVLRILHHRRTSGSLADYGVENLGARYVGVGINHEKATKALEWLRETYPVDEARAAEEWAEREANRIAYELWLADPENSDSKYNDPARIWREQQKEIDQVNQQEEQRMGMLRAGPSEFEKNIQRKRQERLEAIAKKAEQKEAEEKDMEMKIATGEWVRTPGGTQLMKPGQDTYVDVFGREQVSRRKEIQEKYKQKAESGFKSEDDMLKATTMAQRLYPMTAFVLVTLLLCWGFAHYYVPPSPSYRLWPSLSPTTATLAAIIATNALICVAWRITPLWPIMTRYFMHVPGYPRAVQSVLNVFSHVQYEHMIANMMFLALAGAACHDLVGRGIFVGTYIASGAVGSLFTLYWANLGRGSISAHSVGASAAIWGIAVLYCLITDQESVKIPFVKDVEVGFWPKTLLCAFVASEIWNARKKKTTMDHASHFGGMVVGGSVAGYLRATGWHERRAKMKGDGVQQKAKGKDMKTVDVGAMAKEELNEVKEGVKKIVK